jgi:hypothetical protein
MAETILGLPSSAKFAAEGDRFYNHRRKILHSYPNGGAPLTGLLSMIPEEKTNDSIFLWYEKRFKSPVPVLRGTAPVTSTAPTTGDADDGTAITTGAKGITTDYYIKVDTTKDLKPGQILRMETDLSQWYITAVTRGVSSDVLLGYVTVRLVRAYTVGVVATVFAAGTRAPVISSAYGEGAAGKGLKSTGFKRPYGIQNTTQIFRDHFDFPGSVLQMGMKWDKTGAYREKAKDTIVDHMTSLERAILWGQRSTTVRASFDTDQEDLTVRTMSGIEEFLRLWDAGSTGLQIDGSTYAPYSFKVADTLDTDDNKRVIANAAGTITVQGFNAWVERCGRYHTNRTNEKLVLCGSGALIAIVDMFRKNSSFQVRYGEKAYGLTVHTLTTPFGDFHIVSHPLFNEDPVYRYYMMILDVWSLKYRPLGNRDTHLLKNRQNNGDDFRRDEYLTEFGLEFWFPENNMIIQKVNSYTE